MIQASAFDAVAAGYDAAFSNTALGRMLRARVWRVLGAHFRPGQHVLELACGTGEDALWLARRGVQVTATDGAAEMVNVTAAKVRQAGLMEKVTCYHTSLQAISANKSPVSHRYTPFDGVFSNFGGLNALGEWQTLARALAQQVRPGASVVLVVMGPLCPWEIAWHLGHGDAPTALRRFRGRAMATIAGNTIPVWYPSPRRLHQAFAPWFRRRQTCSLGLWLPPSYLGHLVARWPRLFRGLNCLEAATARWTAALGDHYILVLERK